MLTQPMREFLGRQHGEAYLWDIVYRFRMEFELDQRQAGRLIGQWVVETN